jgi:hypothetical protein
MKNKWLVDKILAKGVEFQTFEIYDKNHLSILPETVVHLDERPSVKIVEQLEVVENGKKVWKPVCVVWEKVNMTYTDPKFLESKSQIRLLEIDGNFAGILRTYDKHGEQTESWVMHGLRVTDLQEAADGVNAIFTFHHAFYSLFEGTDGKQ